ncbi:MAG: DEAD/DEAH box helicase family protein [Flavobacteriales bacterium]|nr:DEAD/DEAH box helicase family protein [Flavobacteriales bacterium]
MSLSTPSNFRFLVEEWPSIAKEAMDAERYALAAPIASAVYARRALERTVHWLYDNDSDLQRPYNSQLSALMDERSFRVLIPPPIYIDLQYIRRTGNAAAHDKKVVESQSVASLRLLFRFLKWMGRTYSAFDIEVGTFQEEALIVQVKVKEVPNSAELQQLQERYEAQRVAMETEREQRLKLEGEKQILAERLAAIQERKERHENIPIPASEYSEADTRLLFIDELLREAGWDPAASNVIEYPVTGMPLSTNPNGNGKVDYVLWGADGKPLAVVEAKRTTHDAQQGRVQASLYADCLERMTGQRPVIFYSNGFDTWIWDDTFYGPRAVQGIYTRDELQRVVDRRIGRVNIRHVPIDEQIVERYYQHQAIKRVAESWVDEDGMRGLKRKALIVMATGAGKTRTVAALVDLLLKANWAKRVLFLADRNALVTQAKRAFEKNLPNVTTLDLTKQRYDESARVVFSTYPTVMNRVDQVRSDDVKTFGVGHFDLIIVDEARRSVYDRYGAIFTYFDSLLVGLTATPHDQGDRDTYALFDCEEHNPTSFYELGQAVADRFLVPPIGKAVDFGFLQRGIRYDDLSESDRTHYEETFRDDQGNIPEEIGAPAINNWLFNSNTIDQVLAYVMENGIKVEGGEKLGKTVVFARNIDHARAIQNRFEDQFPQYGGHFMSVVHSKEQYSQSIIDNFSDKDRYPQIAVSVDMLDTGIDIPEIVNLVFFKPVYSKSKFWQMVGRGTRLCPDLFGPGQHKENFRIFDLCGNYSFFNLRPEGIEPVRSPSLSQRIFEATILLSEQLREPAHQVPKDQALRVELLNSAHSWVQALWELRHTVRIRPAQRVLDHYRERTAWNALSKSGISDLFETVGHLIELPDKDELAKRFDLLMLDLEIAVAQEAPSVDRLFRTLASTATQLARLSNIPVVQERYPAIKAVLDVANDQQQRAAVFGLEALEFTRKQLRDLVRLIPREERKVVYSDLRDELVSEGEDIISMPGSYTMRSYRMRVEEFIRSHKHQLTIHKLYTNEPITTAELVELERILFDGDERGTKEALMKELGEERPLGYFIRSIIGLDEGAAKAAFGEFLSGSIFSATQIHFIDSIIRHLTVNGVIDKRMLAEPGSTFTDLHQEGIFGLFPNENDQDKIISVVEWVQGNAQPGERSA